MSNYRRSGNAFYKVHDNGSVTKIEPDANLDYYEYCGLTGEDVGEVLGYDECPVDDFESIMNDVKECARVGSRPNIPPPPGV